MARLGKTFEMFLIFFELIGLVHPLVFVFETAWNLQRNTSRNYFG